MPLAQMRLAKAFSRQGYQVVFCIGYVPEGIDTPAIEGVRVIVYNQRRTSMLLPFIISTVRAEKPDVIFSAEDHLNAIVTVSVIITRANTKLSVSSRVTPYATYSNKFLSKGWILKTINPALWYRADALTCVSKDMVKAYHSIFGTTKHQPVYNIIADDDLYKKMREEVNHPWFQDSSSLVVVAAGRLAPEKGFDDLIHAMRLVNQRTTRVKLAILGDGPLKADLQYQIDGLGLVDTVELIGFQPNPYKFFSKSKLFVLSSYSEGMPNVLVEAMACGCAVVSTDCPTGPREVLRDGQIGELVPVRSPGALADAILRTLNSVPDIAALREAVAPFTEDQVILTHEKILKLC